MKQFQYFLCGVIALLIGCMLFVSCDAGKGNEGDATTGTSELEETDSGTQEQDTPTDLNTVVLVENGLSTYKIVETRSTNETIFNGAKNLQKRILTLTGVNLPIVKSSQITEDDFCIVVGENQNIGETTEVLNTWSIGEYGFAYRNGKLMILGHTDELVAHALNRFLNVLYSSTVKNGEHIDLRIDLTAESSQFLYDNWIQDAPIPTVGYNTLYDCGNQSYMLLFQNFSETQYDTYLTQIEQSNFAKAQENVIGNLHSATYLRGDEQISLSYYTTGKTLRAVFQRNDSVVPIPHSEPETGYQKLGETQLALLSLNYPDPADGSGLSMVITLEDGRFIIIDGGYEGDADGLYNYLTDHNRRSDGIIIAAWILTHGHTDHCGCFSQFVPLYGAKVTCEYVVSNALPSTVIPSQESSNSTVVNNLPLYTGVFKGDTKVIKPHSGEILYFCNVKMEMLMTFEDLYPRSISWLNETSMVFRMTIADQTLLVTADAELQSIDVLSSLYGSALKSDIFQLNHHGFSGGDETFFGYISPSVILWPSSQDSVEVRLLPSWRNGILKDLTDRSDIYFVQDGSVEVLTLPYHFGDVYEEYTMDLNRRKG